LGEAGRRWALEAVTAGSHATVVQHDQWREAVRAYLACVTFVDRQIGDLITALRESPYADNTMIVLWSDHGWQLGEKEHWGKWTGWRDSTRVPLLVVPPRDREDTPRGQRCEEPVGLIDLYPTLIDACGLPPRDELAGRSLMPLLGDPGKETGRMVLTTFDAGNLALTGKRWRYIRYREGEEELYDIRDDPREWRNLAGAEAHRDELQRMRDRLDDEISEAAQ
jgi:arylsulfatase A-like enzyme